MARKRTASPPSRGRGLKRIGDKDTADFIKSPPSRGRGLKQSRLSPRVRCLMVAPFTGAWIETVRSRYGTKAHRSPPSRGRGLKPMSVRRLAGAFKVAPFTGAWIETQLSIRWQVYRRVAPFTGAWIET